MIYFTALTQTCRENHEGNWDMTYFTALTQMCWENRKPKESGSRAEKFRAPSQTSMTPWAGVLGGRSPPAAGPNYTVQGEDA